MIFKMTSVVFFLIVIIKYEYGGIRVRKEERIERGRNEEGVGSKGTQFLPFLKTLHKTWFFFYHFSLSSIKGLGVFLFILPSYNTS